MTKLDIDTAPAIVRAIRDAKANGGQYSGDQLEPRPWVWPSKTWFQLRLAERAQEVKHD